MRFALLAAMAATGLMAVGPARPRPALAQTTANSAAPEVPKPGANSFSESQAQQVVREHGFSDVSPLVNDSKGIWHGRARNGTNNVRVSVDYQGNVTAIPE